jgi:hypothetical protein
LFWAPKVDSHADGKRWWSHRFLADDKMEGRNTGGGGYRKAAVYVAGEFSVPASSPQESPAICSRSSFVPQDRRRAISLTLVLTAARSR